MNFKLFKLYTKIYYNFLLGKINNSIPKLNINSLGIELNKDLKHIQDQITILENFLDPFTVAELENQEVEK